MSCTQHVILHVIALQLSFVGDVTDSTDLQQSKLHIFYFIYKEDKRICSHSSERQINSLPDIFIDILGLEMITYMGIYLTILQLTISYSFSEIIFCVFSGHWQADFNKTNDLCDKNVKVIYIYHMNLNPVQSTCVWLNPNPTTLILNPGFNPKESNTG